MSVTRESSISAGYTNSGTGAAGTPEETSYADAISMALGASPGAGGGTALVFTGDATAVGTDTFAQMSVDATVADHGSSTGISLTAELVAAAAGSEPFAATTVWYLVSGPVDSFIRIEEVETFTASGPDGSVVVQSASVSFTGVVLDDPMQCVVETTLSTPYDEGSIQPPDPGCDCGCGCDGDAENGFALDGNVAVFAVQADAFGDNSYASVSFDALAFEDALSTVTGVVEVAIA